MGFYLASLAAFDWGGALASCLLWCGSDRACSHISQKPVPSIRPDSGALFFLTNVFPSPLLHKNRTKAHPESTLYIMSQAVAGGGLMAQPTWMASRCSQARIPVPKCARVFLDASCDSLFWRNNTHTCVVHTHTCTHTHTYMHIHTHVHIAGQMKSKEKLDEILLVSLLYSLALCTI